MVVWISIGGMPGLRGLEVKPIKSLDFAEVMIFISPFDELPVIRAGLTQKMVAMFKGCTVVL